MNTLTKIYQEKLETLKQEKSGEFKFKKALLERKDMPNLIAEIKHSSPSAGVLKHNFNPIEIAELYDQTNVSAISIITEEKFFAGSLKDLQDVREITNKPILRKDFIFDEFQIYQSKFAGADAILLIVALFRDIIGDIHLLKNLYDLAYSIGLEVLVETHNQEEIEIALDMKAEIIGINTRDLRDFSIDLNRFESLSKLIPKNKIIVAESGIHTHSDVLQVQKSGANAILVGSAIMQAEDISSKIHELTTFRL